MGNRESRLRAGEISVGVHGPNTTTSPFIAGQKEGLEKRFGKASSLLSLYKTALWCCLLTSRGVPVTAGRSNKRKEAKQPSPVMPARLQAVLPTLFFQ